MPHEPIALAVSQCRREKVSSTRNEIAAVENHVACVYDGRHRLVQHQRPGFRFTPSGLHILRTHLEFCSPDERRGIRDRILESQRAAAFARVGAADEGS